MQKGISAIQILVILALLVLAGSMGYVYLQPKKEVSKPPEYKSTAKTAPPESAPVPTPPDETANWKTYRNEQYGFEVKYPPDLILETGSMAAVFYDKAEPDTRCSLAVGNSVASRSIFGYSKIKDVEISTSGGRVILGLLKNEYEAANENYIMVTQFGRGVEAYGRIIYEANPSKCLEVSKNILSTFKFTNPAASIPSVSIEDLTKDPLRFLNQEVVVTGKLFNAGGSYDNPTFFVTDGTNNLRVTVWLPLEVPPPASGSTEKPPSTMGFYTEKIVTLRGKVEKNTAWGYYFNVLAQKK